MTPALRVTTLLALAAGIGLRLSRRDVHSIWFDEAATLCVAEAADPAAVLLQDRHPPLSGLFFRWWIACAGADDAALRLLPALVSCVALVLFAALARCWLGGPRAAAATALLAVAPFPVWIAHEVRMYAFVELGAVLALLGLEWWRRGGTRAGGLTMALGVSLAVGSHYMGGLVVPAIAGVLAVDVAFRRLSLAAALRAALASVAGVAVWLPWLWFALPVQMRTGWAWHTSGLREMAELPARFVLVDASVVPASFRLLTLALAASLALAPVWFGLRSLWVREAADLRVVAAMIAPIAASVALASVVPPSFDARTLVAALPAAVACIAGGLASLPWRPLRVLLLACGIAGSAAIGVLSGTGNRRDDYRSACADVARAWQPGDKIVAVAGTPELFAQHPLRHYLRARPDVLASMVAAADVARLAPSWPAGTRIHVVYRVAEYSRPQLDAIRARCVTLAEGPVRFRVQTWILQVAG